VSTASRPHGHVQLAHQISANQCTCLPWVVLDCWTTGRLLQQVVSPAASAYGLPVGETRQVQPSKLEPLPATAYLQHQALFERPETLPHAHRSSATVRVCGEAARLMFRSMLSSTPNAASGPRLQWATLCDCGLGVGF